jgi:hypothetical protein
MSEATPLTAEEYAESKKKDELIAEAEELNLDATGTKLEIATRIIEREEKFAPSDDDDAPDDDVLKERTVTVKELTDYKTLAREVGFDGDFRDLAAQNGVRNGRYEIEPGTVVTIPPNRLPIRD